MTTITIERELLEEVVEMFDNAISTRYPHEILCDIRAALAAPATAPEQCWCDEQGVGEPGVSCGDCPTRDYKAPDELERLRKDAESWRKLQRDQSERYAALAK